MELLTELEALQKRDGYLTKSAVEELSAKSGVPVVQIYSAASFYEYFHFAPKSERVRHEEYPVRRRDILLTRQETDPWTALRRAKRTPESIIPMVRAAGLLGRSGGAFSTADKWEMTAKAPGDVKFVVCNADEGEPFTGKDCALLKENPEAVISGIAICAEAVGAGRGYIYLRAEYDFLRERIERAISEAPLGDFELTVYMGHGAYECGEETALIASLEGKRGESRLKPPFPGESGLLERPTVVNNVETFACVSYIVELGPELFRKRGAADYPGTKLYTVTGAVASPGVYELPSGVTAGEIFRLAGGKKKPYAVLCGGGSGSFVRPERIFDVPMTPRACADSGASFGTASLMFIEDKADVMPLLVQLMRFFSKESCGVCVPCRIGLRRLAELVAKAESDGLWPEERRLCLELADHIRSQARCGLGKGATVPLLTLADNFPEVFK